MMRKGRIQVALGFGRRVGEEGFLLDRGRRVDDSAVGDFHGGHHGDEIEV